MEIRRLWRVGKDAFDINAYSSGVRDGRRGRIFHPNFILVDVEDEFGRCGRV